MNKSNRYSPEVRERAVCLVFEHEKEYSSQWSAMSSIASKTGCTLETLRSWVRRVGMDRGQQAGMSTHDRERLKTLERENKELRRVNEILKTASNFFTQAEFDRKLK